MTELIENEYAIFWIDEGIFYLNYKNNASIDINAALAIVKDTAKLFAGGSQPYGALCDMTNLRSMDKEARDYFAGMFSSIKVAIISESVTGQTVADFYVQISNPKSRTKYFSDWDEA